MHARATAAVTASVAVDRRPRAVDRPPRADDRGPTTVDRS